MKGKPMKCTICIVLLLLTAVFQVCADDISLTVYNTDLAVVRIAEEMSFSEGEQQISFTDVAARIDPTSVRFSTRDGGVRILEQNFRYDLVNSQKVLSRYLDECITIVVEEGELVEGFLQSAAGDIVVKTREGGIKIVKLDAVRQFVFPALPEGLITRPTLVWNLMSDRALSTGTEVSYMTGGMIWNAQYTAVVSSNEKEMELSSWVSINNTSGMTYENAGLKLVAGDIHLVEPQRMMKRDTLRSVAAQEVDRAFEERELFEYHLYELARRTTINNAEIKQISLFPAATTKALKRFVYDPWKDQKKVAVMVEFTNSEKDGLGMPLPAGKVRVFKRDTDETMQFVGEDEIDHTPRNELVRLTLGYAFDILAERKVIDTRRISQTAREESIELSLRNRKKESATITAREHLWGDWEIVKTTDEHVKKDARTAEFTVTIPADSEKTIAYTVRYR